MAASKSLLPTFPSPAVMNASNFACFSAAACASASALAASSAAFLASSADLIFALALSLSTPNASALLNSLMAASKSLLPTFPSPAVMNASNFACFSFRAFSAASFLAFKSLAFANSFSTLASFFIFNASSNLAMELSYSSESIDLFPALTNSANFLSFSNWSLIISSISITFAGGSFSEGFIVPAS